MSLTDDSRADGRPPGPPPGPPAQRDGGQFDRTPPQDIAAEQCVLGGMLLSKDAVADVVEMLKSTDFYRPVHATIFDKVLDLYGRGEPADAITVAAALADSGDLARIGGAPYLHTCMAAVPTAANAAYYARIVSERAVLRRLVEAGTRIVQLGYGSGTGGGRDVDDVVDLAQQAVYEVTERRVSEDFAVLADMLQPTLDEIEAVGAQSGVMTGVPTGFTDLDRLLNGLHPGQLIIVAGRPGLGKALALDTPLATPEGWTTMADVRVGDRLLGADGRPTTVLAAFEVLHDRPCYEVEFSDGSVVVADAEHLWLASAAADDGSPAGTGSPVPGVRPAPRGEVQTTEQIRDSMYAAAAGRRHSVHNSRPLDLPERDLPVPPYELGTRIGAGRDGAGDRLPPPYLRASEPQRRALLAGLLDAAGHVDADGDIRYAAGSARLAEDVSELVVGLGYGCSRPHRSGGGPARPTDHQLTFRASEDVFRRSPCLAVHRARRGTATGAGSRDIVGIRPVASVPVRCVTVDNGDHLYLAGRAMIPTHNSTASMDFARNAAIRANHAAAIFSLEMSKVEIVMRLLSAEARVPLHVLRSGQLSDDDWTKLARCMGEISEAPLFVDDTPNMNLMEIRAKARRLKQRHDLKMIVVDYLQLMSSPKRVESRQQEVAELSRGLKLLAKEVECPVIAVSQLNRGPEQRTDKRPQLSDLRESGCLTADTRVIRADTNAEITLGELLAGGLRDVPVWALDDRLRYTPRTMTHAFPSGIRRVYRLTLGSGRTIEATGNHPFLTFEGWRSLAELPIGARIATPRHVPAPLRVQPWPEEEVTLLAHLLGSGFGDGAGSVAGPDRIGYASRDEENLEAVAIAAKHFGVAAVRDERPSAYGSVLRFPAPPGTGRDGRHPIVEWLEGLGLLGRRPSGASVPASVFALPKEQVTHFLRHLWGAAGRVEVGESGRPGRISYPTPSRRLAEDVSRLLLRYGITGRLLERRSAGPGQRYVLDIPDRDDQVRFLREIGVHGERSGRCARLLATLERPPGGAPVDAVPARVWSTVRAVLADPGDGAGPESKSLARIAAVFDDADLDLHATNDVYWDEVVSVESLGERAVFDATVLGVHNFIANGIAVHNSIEQDADVVILLHRDDYYDKESPRAGEADFIVAKHRNGPTDTVTVAAQLHLSRFVDMAIV
ncbi:replicative DNA helicase [Plantactinospora sp. KBS50]|nr:replicative DNA helicase [Plantactinospora sp. KBS50]